MAREILFGMVPVLLSKLSNNRSIAMWEESGRRKRLTNRLNSTPMVLFGESRLEKKRKNEKMLKRKRAKG